MPDTATQLEREIVACRRCPRLVAWLEEVGRTKRAAFRDEDYWCRPVPSLGPIRARLLIVGLAPGAHGANRTGRPFTGDGAGPFLYSALHRAGFSDSESSTHRRDGLRLVDARIANAVRCAPPGNKPTREEFETCQDFLVREMDLMKRVRVVLCLGGLAWNATLKTLAASGVVLPRPRPRFGHGAEARPGAGAPTLLGCYHPSQLNTFTGRLTPPMMDELLERARGLLDA